MRAAGAAILVPTILIAAMIVRFTIDVTRSLTGQTEGKRRNGSNHFSGHFFAGMALKHIESAGQTQVTQVRVRDSSGQIFTVRIEGHLLSGAIAPADHVTFGLRTVDGVYVLTDGENHTTREPIRLAR